MPVLWRHQHGYQLNTHRMIVTFLSLAAAGLGFAAGKLWEQYTEKRKAIEIELWKLRVAELEKRLREFYWPIYLRLQRDNVVWEKILKRWEKDAEAKQLGHQLELDVTLPNHIEIVRVIEQGMHYVRGDKELEGALLQYLRHVDVYRSIRAAGITDKDPKYFGEPYPHSFFQAIDERVKRLQAEYDSILAEQTNG